MEEEEESDRAEAAEQAAQEVVDEDDAADADAEAEDTADEDTAEEETADEGTAETDADSDEAEAAGFDETAGFPENFPRVSRLKNAGVNSIAELREIDDLTELDGIGSSYAEDIEDGLAEFDETGAVSA